MKKHSKAPKFRKKSAPHSQDRGSKRTRGIKRGRGREERPQAWRGKKQERGGRGHAKPGKYEEKSQFTPKLTHKQQKQQQANRLREEQVLSKIVIEQELKKPLPNFQKIKQYLIKIKSRGSKQRLRNKAERLQRSLTPDVPS